jgi:NhaP-type Na+/H+ or K+/H+ antiporter
MGHASTVFDIGAICFGLVIGWITYRTLRRSDAAAVSDIATVIGAVGGGAVLGIFKLGDSFGWYAIGLAVGFFGYLGVSLKMEPALTRTWMSGHDRTRVRPGEHVDDRKVETA